MGCVCVVYNGMEDMLVLVCFDWGNCVGKLAWIVLMGIGSFCVNMLCSKIFINGFVLIIKFKRLVK